MRAAALAIATLLCAGCVHTGSEERPRAAKRERPGDVLVRFASSDLATATQLVTRETRARIERGQVDIARGVPWRLARRPRFRVVLSERITADWAVAAIRWQRGVYAAALRRERGAWRVELGAPIRLRALRPDPGERLRVRTQVAVEVKASAPILEGGVWLDGKAVTTRSGGPSDRYLTFFSDADRVGAGTHAVVAVALAGDGAAALAWTFHASGGAV